MDISWISLFGIVASMFAWVALFELNELAFARLEWAQGINWIFLPAAARLGAALIFHLPGAVGIVLGSLLTSHDVFGYGVNTLGIASAIASGAAPLIAVRLTTKYYGLPSTLQGMSAKHLIACTVAYAACNAVIHNIVFWFLLPRTPAVSGTIHMFIGDLAGALLVLYSVKLLLMSFSGKRNRPGR